MKNRKGFTLVELLVVIAIIGLLSTLAIVSLNSARAKARDATRLSDLRQFQTAMELFYDANSSKYTLAGWTVPVAISGLSDAILLATAPNVTDLTDPSGKTGTLCTATSSDTCEYSVASNTATNYIVYGYLEAATGGFSSGVVTLTTSGLED